MVEQNGLGGPKYVYILLLHNDPANNVSAFRHVAMFHPSQTMYGIVLRTIYIPHSIRSL